MYRGTEDKSVCCLRLFHEFVYAILTETFSGLYAGITADTTGYGLCPHLDDLCLNAISLQCSRYFFQCRVGTSFCMSASVYQ